MIPHAIVLLFASARPPSVRDFGRDPPRLGDVVRTDEWWVVVGRNRHWSRAGADGCTLTVESTVSRLWRGIDARDVREVRS